MTHYVYKNMWTDIMYKQIQLIYYVIIRFNCILILHLSTCISTWLQNGGTRFLKTIIQNTVVHMNNTFTCISYV